MNPPAPSDEVLTRWLPQRYRNLTKTLKTLDVDAEYKLILQKKSRQPRAVRDAIVSIAEKVRRGVGDPLDKHKEDI